MIRAEAGEAYIENDGINFDVYWQNEHGHQMTENVLVFIDRHSEAVFVSCVDASYSLNEHNPAVSRIGDLAHDHPALYKVVIEKLTSLDCHVAEQALLLSQV